MTNRYPGHCSRCKEPVAAGEGTVEKVRGSWVVYHETGACEKRRVTAAEYEPTARNILSRSRDQSPEEYETWVREVCEIAAETQSGIMHAAHLWSVAHPPETRCELCDEPSHKLVDGVHGLCKARFERGGPDAVKPIPYEDAPCYCSPCSRERGEETPYRFSAVLI